MKKKSDSVIKKVFSSLINVPKWFDWERVKTFTLFVGDVFKRLFVPQSNATPTDTSPVADSFAAAQEKLHLTDAELLLRQNALFRLSMLMLCIATGILIYSGYHFFHGAIKAGLISLVVMTIALALAFRYHFWYFQIKSRKLGCTVQQWFKSGLLGEKE